jgi:serine/threonine protein kinase
VLAADFGLTCEAISTAHRFTDSSRGTLGYRAPELLKDDSAGFTNKVDIWAMGCILCAKPFVDDWAVAEYSRGESELETCCHANVDKDAAKMISDAIRELFHSRPSQRPNSAGLAEIAGSTSTNERIRPRAQSG